MILLFGQNIDPHVQKIKELLNEIDIEYCIFDYQNCYESDSITYCINDGKFDLSFSTENKNKIIHNNDIHSVWWRMKPPLIQPKETVETLRYEDLRNREWSHVLRPLYENTNAKWINKLDSQHRASHKIYQLGKAIKMGFSIPNTIISNDFNEIEDFIRKHDSHSEVIYKPLTYFWEPPGKITTTTVVSLDLLNKISSSAKVTPGIYQTRIQKKYELRITIVGEMVFAIRIDTLGIPEAELDWRTRTFNVKYSKFEIPNALKTSLLKLHKSFDLFYGAYDFIVTEDDKWIFLEVNPGGQWLWLEEETGIPISKALADSLIIK